jgi:hypothetical protein
MMPPIQLTVFTKDDGPLTKVISLAKDGLVKSDGSSCVMTSGKAERYYLKDITELAELIERLDSNQAIALGALRPELPDEIEITTKDRLDGVRYDLIARTANSIIYEKEQPALALFDFDTKDMSPEVAQRIDALGGFWEALAEVVPELKDAARVVRRSTSAGLSRCDTGEKLPGSNGMHGYIAARDGSDIPRFLDTLHQRCWLAGWGWMTVGVAGQFLERSIIDRTVSGAERLVFEGPPIIKRPLAQDQEERRAVTVDGETIDTHKAVEPLTVVEQQTLRKLKVEAQKPLMAERNKKRDAHMRDLIERRKLSVSEAKKTIECADRGVLLPSAPLAFDNPQLNNFTVADILDDPAGFEGVTLADPNEGVEYGRCKAKVLRRADGIPWIHSFAHGRTIYQLKYDASAVRARLDKGDGVELILAAELDPVEEKQLVDEIARRDRVSVKVVAAKLKKGGEAAASAEPGRVHPLPDAPLRGQDGLSKSQYSM